MISVLHPLGIGQPSCNWSKMSVDHKLVDKWWCFAMMQFDYFFSVLRWCLVSPRVTRVELIASCIKNNAKFPCNWVQHDPKKIALRGLSNRKLVFCYRNCSDLLWEKIVLVIEKTFEIRGWRSRIFKYFEITRTIYSNSERSEQS